MDEELIEMLFDYIDKKVEDAIFNHKVANHSGCYYSYSNDADEVKRNIRERLMEKK